MSIIKMKFIIIIIYGKMMIELEEMRILLEFFLLKFCKDVL